MADPRLRLRDNAPGRFFVDSECTDCDTCRCLAPGLFARNDEAGYSYVVRQPVDDDEADELYEAMDRCPADAIGEM
ncbi:ferredoxin [Streptomyces sp. TP-A0356]|uniref:YtkI n=1 Tax=Streptomyces sp. TP-A2060 TaxID=991125 RepID=I3NN55_9ACTN|nr:ferredoxin [Streptomyces sp. TP-A0356]ADZ13543.1 YtkI [Streptomyces sp. TP-A2060]